MHSEIAIIDLNSFSKLLETIHICHKDSKSNLRKMISSSPHIITFDCCDFRIPVNNLRILSSEEKIPGINSLHLQESPLKDVQYEKVIFIGDDCHQCFEPKPLAMNFDSVFVNIDEGFSVNCAENIQQKEDTNSKEIDPLMIEQNSNLSRSVSIIEKAFSCNSFQISAKNFRPKVVDWSAETIENISEDSPPNRKSKYPSVLICEFCGLQFRDKDRVYNFFHHRNQAHTQEVQYKCPLCPKIYWGERELSAHVVSHVGKEHMCEFCGINFQRKNDLVRHLLIHGEKKLSCQFCRKLFRRKDHLRIHERIHTHENPYVCPKCQLGFPQKHQLNFHLKKCKSRLELQTNRDACNSKIIACT